VAIHHPAPRSVTTTMNGDQWAISPRACSVVPGRCLSAGYGDSGAPSPSPLFPIPPEGPLPAGGQCRDHGLSPPCNKFSRAREMRRPRRRS
jgi:hypothetical protein